MHIVELSHLTLNSTLKHYSETVVTHIYSVGEDCEGGSLFTPSVLRYANSFDLYGLLIWSYRILLAINV